MKKMLLLYSLFIWSCTNNKKEMDSNNSLETDTSNIQTINSLRSTNKSNNCAELKIKDGKWVSKSDSFDFFLVRNNLLYYMQDEDTLDVCRYYISEVPKNRAYKSENTCYMITIGRDLTDTMEYSIDNLTENELSLIYLIRGNELSYKRVK